ncbi:putative defense protein Hdd11 [Hetaerina americana]|uniref:putative defense protein Hdd11 n=1 Tax=Hetaerina americana TaxID=62018 RepID=UPI003A7F5C66
MNQMWLLAVLAALSAMAYGYEKGAPELSCDDMKPRHGADEQVVTNPYYIKLSKNQIRPGGKVNVLLTGRDNFKGFFVQGRVGNKAVGHFDVAPGSKLVNCQESVGNAITHINNSYKSSITLTWNAPKGLNEKVIFWFTVVKEGHLYWVADKSDVLTVAEN